MKIELCAIDDVLLKIDKAIDENAHDLQNIINDLSIYMKKVSKCVQS